MMSLSNSAAGPSDDPGVDSVAGAIAPFVGHGQHTSAPSRARSGRSARRDGKLSASSPPLTEHFGLWLSVSEGVGRIGRTLIFLIFRNRTNETIIRPQPTEIVLFSGAETDGGIDFH
jgi:hypothetical protein